MFNFLKVEINAGLELTVRAQRAAFKATWAKIGRKWETEMLPLHFTTQAQQRYGYKPRTSGTLRKKKRLARMGLVESGGIVPLVWSGVMRRALTLYRQRQSVYPTRVTTHLRGPSYLSINSKPNRPNLAREVTAVSANEKTEMARFAKDTLRDASLAEFKKTKLKKTIRAR